MTAASFKARTAAAVVGRIFLVFLGWCLVMLLYGLIYGEMEGNAVPVTISPFRDVNFEMWNEGYVSAKGSFKNISAENDGDELTLQTADISCRKDEGVCTIGTADVFEGFMNLDVSRYNIDVWDDKEIRFSDSSSICADWSYIIDRATGTINGWRRKKTVIPDYALKSSRHPCDGLKELHIALVRGDQVHGQKIKSFEAKNSLRLHLFMVLLNLIYFALVARWEFRRRQRNTAKIQEPAYV